MPAIEKRIYTRFDVADCIYVSVNENDRKIAKLKNLSMGGLAYQHMFDKKLAKREITLNILDVGNKVTIIDIPCKTIYDVDPEQGNPKKGWFKSSGVKFNALTAIHKQQLETLIKDHCLLDKNKL